MEHQKILKSLNKASDSKFVTRKQNIASDQLNTSHNLGNEILYNRKVSKSNIGECNNAYMLVKGNITIAGYIAAPEAFKNCGPFINCITKKAENLNLVMPM